MLCSGFHGKRRVPQDILLGLPILSTVFPVDSHDSAWKTHLKLSGSLFYKQQVGVLFLAHLKGLKMHLESVGKALRKSFRERPPGT